MTQDRDIEAYSDAYLSDYGFEAEMVHYRRQSLLERLGEHNPKTVIEIGCGVSPLFEAWAQAGGKWDRWHVVEPATTFTQAARDIVEKAELTNVEIHQAFFEEARLEGTSPDMVICAGLLQEVPSSTTLLRQIAVAMGSNSVLHINVANAASFHRRLALAMGLITNLADFSARNTMLDQRRVYDADLLKSELEQAGLKVSETGGILLKPLTHRQLEAASDVFTRDVLEGLNALGCQYPLWASEIWAEAVLA